jgi:FemAB-related protein (PEP-CTERM system-associated)
MENEKLTGKIKDLEFKPHEEHDFGKDTRSCKVRMIMNLPRSSEQLLGSFKSKLRSQIRKAEKNGLTFRRGEEKDIGRFYSVFSQNMLDIGSPVHSVKWFQEIVRCYGRNCHIGLVEKDVETVGGGIILTVGDKVSIPWASTLRGFNRFSPNMLLYWNLLKFSSDNGFRAFDFGRSSIDSGTHKFKAQWGAYPVTLHWYDINTDGEQENDNAGSSSKRDTAARLWSKMPLPVANTLGPIIRKYISL